MVVEIDLVPGNCPPLTDLVLGSIIPSSYALGRTLDSGVNDFPKKGFLKLLHSP